MKVLFVASECAPFAKAGGLGDVVGSLPKALKKAGHDVRVLLPRYDTVKLRESSRHDRPLAVPLGWSQLWCAVVETRLPGSDVPVYLLEHDMLYARGYLYDPPNGFATDNLARFGLLCRGALALARHLDWTPDVLHVHDWPTALLPVMLNSLPRTDPMWRVATVLTLHNIAHQPRFHSRDLHLVGLGNEYFRGDGLEDHGYLNPLKGGLYHATKLTAVSPRYLQEIQAPEGGAGLDGVVRFRGGDCVGILNGVDEDVWDPAADPHLPARYSAEDLSGKAVCKRELQKEMSLAERPDVPLCGVVSRMGDQKGTDVIAAALDDILALDTQLVLLGSGDGELEAYFRQRSHYGGDRFRAYIGYSEPLAHRIEAGCDLFLMPSRFEPCGLNQLYSQRYGTLPIVRATGGLDDTVEQCNPATGEGTGFKLWDLHAHALTRTVSWACDIYRWRRDVFRPMQLRAMRKRFGWDVTAGRYAEVYGWAVAARTAGAAP